MMRIFKDLELFEHLGSGIILILEAYPCDCFRFTENFLRMTFPNEWNLNEDESEILAFVAQVNDMTSGRSGLIDVLGELFMINTSEELYIGVLFLRSNGTTKKADQHPPP